MFLSSLAVLAPRCSPQITPPKSQHSLPIVLFGSDRALSPSKRQAFLRQAAASYYNLKTEGVTGFRFEIVPDWDSISKHWQEDAIKRKQDLSILKRTHFRVVIGPQGSQIFHQPDIAPPNKEVADRVAKSIRNVDMAVVSFFRIWGIFAISSPFSMVYPDYRLEDLGETYRLTCKGLFISMSHDFAITELRASAPEESATVYPKLVASRNGFVVVGLNIEYKAEGGPIRDSTTIEYQDVNGLKVPRFIKTTTMLPTGNTAIPFTFTNFQVDKR
jgi:hypothetical protein